MSCNAGSLRWRLTVHSSSLRHAQLDGVFVSITPADPALWVGVIFVRKGTSHLPGQSFPCRCLRHPTHPQMFTMHRALCSRSAAFSDLVPAHLPVSASPRDLFNRCLPPAAHATHHVHVHDGFVRHGHGECNRRRTTPPRWLQSSTRFPAVVRTRTAVRSKLPQCKRVGPGYARAELHPCTVRG